MIKCPICDYEVNMCQCLFAGDCHPDRTKNREVVLDNLHLLTDEQIRHSTNRVLYHTQPDDIEFPPAAVGGERSGVERRKHRTGEDHQKDGPNADRHLCKTCIY